MARKHAFGFIRRFDRGQKSPERRRPAGRGMFRSLRIEAIEARVLLSAAGVESDGLLDIAPEESEASAFTFNLSGDPVLARALGNSVFSGAGAEAFGSSSGDGGIDSKGQPSMNMETPSFARFVPEQVHNSSSQDPAGLVDITVAMGTSQRPGSLEAVGLRGDFRRGVDRTLIQRAEKSGHQILAVDGQYAMLQAFELSGGEFDSVEVDDASTQRQSPRPRRDDPLPHRATRPSDGDRAQANPAVDRQEHVTRRDAPLGSSAEAALKADDESRDDERFSPSPAPINHGPRAEVFEQLGENQASDLFGPAAYLNLGRKSGTAPAMIVVVGGQFLLGASWRTRRCIMHEPAFELPLRQ